MSKKHQAPSAAPSSAGVQPPADSGAAAQPAPDPASAPHPALAALQAQASRIFGDKGPIFRTERRTVTAAVLLAALIFLPWLGAVGLWDCWEVHYGEVAREMVARHDPIYPYWENAYFFSKPPLTMWMQALGIWLSNGLAEGNSHLGIYVEWAMRLPFAALMILAVALLTLAIGRTVSRRAGLFSGVVLSTSPLFFLLARQTVTDTPFVALITCGMSAFMLAELSPQAVRARELTASENEPEKQRLEGDVTFWWLLAYAFFGLATLAKGLLGFALPGAILLAYLLVTWDWALLKRARILPGLVIFLAVALPWYLTLSLFDGKDDGSKTFVERFFIHDHFNRLNKGVHTTTPNTTFTYFIEQLGFAVFPWLVLVPAALGRLLKLDIRSKIPADRAVLLSALWAAVAFLVFTLSATKFHHYCFPIVPALAVLTAAAADELMTCAKEGDSGKGILLLLFGLILYAVVAHDLWKTPAHLINMYVYKYDRPYPLEEVAPQNAFMVLFILGGTGMAAAFVNRARKPLVAAVTAFAVAFAIYGSWVHWKNLTYHWSQRDIFWAYYQGRKSTDEPIGAYYMNWRGETFYSSNTIRQIKKPEKFNEFLDQKGTVWILVEQNRYEKMSKLVLRRNRKIEIVDRSGNKFFLARSTER